MKNELLRHTLSAIAYRFNKAVGDVDTKFGDFDVGSGTRTPNEIIHHMYHVLNATRIFIEEEKFHKDLPEKVAFNFEVERFNSELMHLDILLTKLELEINYSKRLLQGPLSDLFTHIGQISMLSRMYGNPIVGEDFASATLTSLTH